MAIVQTGEVQGEDNRKAGELLYCGATCWEVIGRKKVSLDTNLVSPTLLRPLVGVNISFVASGCASCHCIALDTQGRCYTWGRNEKGQLGHGDTLKRDSPTLVSALSKFKVVKGGSGKSHTVVVTDDGQSFAFGWNKHGQLGFGSVKNECEPSPVKCLVSDVTTATCGAEFTVWLSSIEGSSIITAGLPQYGQLGHGTDNEYNMKESSVKLVYEPQPRPKAIASLSNETIVKIACGSNHSVAVDSNGFVYTWGFGGYGRLGHREQKDEWVPRRVDVFQRNNVLPPNAIVSAGAANSACTAGGGQLYMWGKLKNTGDDWMYPKPLMDLSGWNLRSMDSGFAHHFVGADTSCISWGNSQYGELGYGPLGPKSSANPKKVDSLEGMFVIGVACGMAHSLAIVDRTGVEERLNQMEIYDGNASQELNAETDVKEAVAQAKGAKRKAAEKKQEVTSESEAEESEEEESDYDEESASKKGSRKRGSGGPRGRGRGRGRGKSAQEKAPTSVKPRGGRAKSRKR